MKDTKKSYKEFQELYSRSGMTQKEFSVAQGISASMVSYYLRKARESESGKNNVESPSELFQPLEVMQTGSPSCIRLDLPHGITLTLTL